MKKLIMVLLIAIASTTMAFEFDKTKLELDGALEMGIPIGDFGDIANFGIGFSSKAYYHFNNKLDITARLGYTHFSGEKFSAAAGYGLPDMSWEFSFSVVPIMFGATYKFLSNQPNLYASGELGFNFFTTSTEYEGDNMYGVKPKDDSDTDFDFTFAPRIGYILDVNGNKIDINVGFRFIELNFNIFFNRKQKKQ